MSQYIYIYNFGWQVYLLNYFVPFQKRIKQPCYIELHFICGRVSGSTPVFFSTLEVRLSGCLATCHPERLLHNANSLVMPTLALFPEESWNYHVLRALILFCQNFHIYDNYSAVWLFHVIVIVCLSLYDNFCNYNGKEKRCKVKI